MVQFQRMTLWLAAFFGCAGTAFIVVYLLARKPDAYLLSGAAIGALFSAASLLAGVVFVCIESAWRRRSMNPSRVPFRPGPVAVPASTLSEQFQQRQEVLSERLNIDEPHFCTLAQAPCTSWSFCGSAPDTHPVSAATDREGAGALGMQAAAAHGQAMPVIVRSGVPVSCLALAPGGETSGTLPRKSDQAAESA